MLSRREFFGAPALIGLWRKTDRKITGGFVNDSFPLGHRLRDRAAFRAPTAATARPHRDCRRRHGRFECRLASGQTRLSRFRAARNGAAGRRQLALWRKRDLKVSVGRALRSRSRQRRIAGARTVRRAGPVSRWQMGRARAVLRSAGASVHQRPLAGGHRARRRRDTAGSRAISPLHGKDQRVSRVGPIHRSHGAQAPSHHRSIETSMADWLAQQGFDSPPLRWYINYACRDDYGALAKDTSAWAGVQYFASREPEEKGPLTWPEGNGWIARAIDRKAEAISADRRRGVSRCAKRQQNPRSYRADRVYRGRRDLGRSDVSCVLHHRGRAARRWISILAMAYGQPDARSHSRTKQRRTGVGQRRSTIRQRSAT